MQKQIAAHTELRVEGQPVSIRIGCHFGPVVLETRDVFGASVHTANRMTSQAKAGQIITTAAMVERLSPEWRASVRQIDVATIRGQGGEVALYEVLWQTEDVTSMLPSIALTNASAQALRLRLSVQDREWCSMRPRPQIAIGRADDNDLVVRGNLISRLHARIEFSRNRFTLTDQSTNGTFVQIVGRGGGLRPPRQHAHQGRGLDRPRTRAGPRFSADDPLRLRRGLAAVCEPGCDSSRRETSSQLREHRCRSVASPNPLQILTHLLDFLAPGSRAAPRVSSAIASGAMSRPVSIEIADGFGM